ncbi:MAG: 30S ribosomal protein S3 [Candidatus Saccharimonadales bacterium]
MGQKVNPISMRLQVNKDWKSKWFAGGQDYKKLLNEDLEIRQFINKNVDRRAGIDRVDIERSPNNISISIYTAKPGVVIGRGGSGIEELKLQLIKIVSSPLRLNIEEVKRPELRARLVAENIAGQLERRINFRRAVKATADATMRAGAKGVKITVAGRLNGAEMARRETEILGSIPLHTIRANIDYAHAVARTTYGVIGVKVWIYKGDNL